MNQDPESSEPASDTTTTTMHANRGEWVWVNIQVGTVVGNNLMRTRLHVEKLDY